MYDLHGAVGFTHVDDVHRGHALAPLAVFCRRLRQFGREPITSAPPRRADGGRWHPASRQGREGSPSSPCRKVTSSPNGLLERLQRRPETRKEWRLGASAGWSVNVGARSTLPEDEGRGRIAACASRLPWRFQCVGSGGFVGGAGNSGIRVYSRRTGPGVRTGRLRRFCAMARKFGLSSAPSRSRRS